MIRIYLDWNVMAQMKNGFHEDFYKIISNKEQFLIIYSTSHISDIYSSYSDNEQQQELINSDLEYISFLTNNYCAYNNGKDIIIDFYNPKTMFDQKVDETDILTDFNLDKLLSSFGGTDNETNESIKKGIETLRSLPIESIFKDVLDNPISRSELEKLFPGLENNLTFEGLVNSGLKMFRGLSDKEDYKDLRTVLQNGLGINRDKMFDKDFPYSSIEQTYLKLGIELPFNTVNKKHAPKWFNEITDNYLLLDMHGYQEDKIVVKKRRKQLSEIR